MIIFTPETPSLLCATIETFDDSIVEDTETFSFLIQSDDHAVLGVLPSSGQITLLDNDCKD